MTAIEVVTVEQLVSSDPIGASAVAGLTYIEDLPGATDYARKPPFRLDMAEADADQRPLVELYFAQSSASFAPVRHFSIENALVVGQGTVIAGETRLIRDSAAEFLAHGHTPDGLVRLEDGTFALGTGPHRVIERPSLLLKRPWYANYGHWLVDSAALASMAATLTMPPDWQIVVAPQPNDAMRAIVAETLALLAPGIDVVEHPDDEVWRFSDLHYVGPVHVPPLFKLPVGLSCLRALVLRGGLGRRAPQRAIYVTRGPLEHRALRNEDEVIALCEQLGIAVIAPEGSSLQHQASLFHSASLVIGVKGAALTNAVFCTPRAHLVVLSPGDFPDPFYWDLVAQSGVQYSEIFGRVVDRGQPQAKNPFTVDIAKLGAVLAACFDDIASVQIAGGG